MKKNIIIPILISLFIFVGCVEDLPTTSTVELEPGNTYLSLRSTEITVPDDGVNPESITLESLRILVFNNSNGLKVTNEVFDISEKTATKKEGETAWTIDLSDIKVKTNPGSSTVYVVLNENESLTTKLNQVTSLFSPTETDLTAMENLVKVPLAYTPLVVTYDEETGQLIEPPFVMVAFGEVEIEQGILNVVDLRGEGSDPIGFAMDRTMAKVTISKVTSEPYTDYTGTTDYVKTSYIHILKMGLVNVPETYLWSPPNNLVPYGGTYKNFIFDLPVTTPQINYYGREWGGSISATTGTINVVWRQYGRSDKRIYRVFASSGSNMYGLTFNPAITFSDTIPAGNEGNFPKYLIEYFKTGNAGEAYTGDLDIPAQNLNFNVTGAPWTLNEKNISYYVPENIIGESTKLHVKAAIASVDFASTVKFTEDQVTWVMKGNEKDWIYPSDDVAFANIVTNAFRFISKKHVIYNDATKEVLFDESKINVSDGAPYYHFWDATFFWREARGTVSVSQAGLAFSDPSKSANIKDFYIPIQNTTKNTDGTESPNGDYNIYRNNEYKFSVHVLNQWTSTRSASQDPNQSMVLRIVPE